MPNGQNVFISIDSFRSVSNRYWKEKKKEKKKKKKKRHFLLIPELFRQNANLLITILVLPDISIMVRVFTGRPWFNPRSRHIKDSKNGT